MKNKIVILFCAVMVLGLACIVGASSIITSGTWDNHDYAVVCSPCMSWENAANDLLGNYNLAAVTSQPEQSFLESLLEGISGQYWLGGYQPREEMNSEINWSWVTGEDWGWANWYNGEPNDFYGPGSEQHLAMWGKYNWRWNDEVNLCNMSGYIAECAPVPEPATMLLLGCGLIGLAGIGRKKLFSKN